MSSHGLDVLYLSDGGLLLLNGELVLSVIDYVREELKDAVHAFALYLLPRGRVLVSVHARAWARWYVVHYLKRTIKRLDEPLLNVGPAVSPDGKRLDPAVTHELEQFDGSGRFILQARRRTLAGYEQDGMYLLTVHPDDGCSFRQLENAEQAVLSTEGATIVVDQSNVLQVGPGTEPLPLCEMSGQAALWGRASTALLTTEGGWRERKGMILSLDGREDLEMDGKICEIATSTNCFVWQREDGKCYTYNEVEHKIYLLPNMKGDPQHIQESLLPGRGPLVYTNNHGRFAFYQNGKTMALPGMESVVSEERALARLLWARGRASLATVLPVDMIAYLSQAIV